jgi:uncharacterized tellurite resistance protein B-like protein
VRERGVTILRLGDRERMGFGNSSGTGIAAKPFPQRYQRLARTMFGPIKYLISNLVGEAVFQPQFKDHDARLATTALLIRVATVHSELSIVRQRKLHSLLRSWFAFDDRAITQLIEDAVEIDRIAIELYQCTRQLTKVLDDQGRRHIVRMMWEIVCADGNANALEDNIIWRAADLLGVSSRQRVELRHQILADRAVGLARDNIDRSYSSPATIGD